METPDYKDRSTGLIIFGILTLLAGGLVALFIPLTLLGQVMAARAAQTPTNYPMILPAMAIYGILAIALIWLGIGSIMARRWARALLLILSWSWFGVGIFALIVMGFVMPAILSQASEGAGKNGAPALPPGALASIMGVMFLVLGVVFILLPLIWIFFYRSPHVKATIV